MKQDFVSYLFFRPATLSLLSHKWNKCTKVRYFNAIMGSLIMGIRSKPFLKATIILVLLLPNHLYAQFSERRRGPASPAAPSSNIPVVESSNFICSRDGEAYECDVKGQPVSHAPGGAATRQELINRCVQNSTNIAGCERLIDSMAPINSIPVSRVNEPAAASNQSGSNFSNDSDRQKYEDCMRNNLGTIGNPDEIDALCRTQSAGNSTSERKLVEEDAAGSSCNAGQVSVSDGIGGTKCETRPATTQDPKKTETARTESTPAADINVCNTAKINADSACDSESKNWMRTINQVSGLLGSQLNQGACGTLAAAQAGSAASLTAYSMQCGSAVESCLNECRKFTNAVDQLTRETAARNATACNAKGASAKKTEADVGAGIQQIAQAVKACHASFGVAAVDPNFQGPDYVGKPQGDILGQMQPRNDQGLNHEGVGGGITGEMNSNVDLSDLVDDTPAPIAGKPKGMGQDPGGQQGSAGLGGGGGVGVDASSGRNANRKGNTGLLSNILSGFFGGGGGGLFGGGRSTGGGGSGGWFGGTNNNPQAASKTPDLRQFLPGAKFDPKKDRGIAGRIVSKDGISGPHGNVWRDISNRYQVKRASLLP